MDHTWAVVGVGSPGVPLSRDLGEIKLALTNSLMHYLPSTLWRNAAKRKGRKIHGPTPSSPPVGTHEITLGRPASESADPTIEPLFNKWSALALRVGRLEIGRRAMTHS
ncbi:hypothetical protein H5410_041237 [Solanum commersonii]|uniref:Uncharacterized protein n=1 Tax=Solanum commersonii TaxID=4109 RepID=A0A9J5XR10_SOLCO|nr:hypothetical protein H5410_041237 [Solanum commersonii]